MLTNILFMKWVTVAVYWGVAGLYVLAGKRLHLGKPWLGLGVAYIILTLNKMADLSGMITRYLRREAVDAGWYGGRAELQIQVMLGIAIASLLVFIVLLLWTVYRKWTGAQRIGLLMLFYLAGFAMLRSVSLHAFDALLYRPRHGVRLNWVFELFGLFVAGLTVGLVIFLKNRANKKRPDSR
jgi:hypothetical protein